jgi:hypothetical protein
VDLTIANFPNRKVVDEQFDALDSFPKTATLQATCDFEMRRIARLPVLDEGINVSGTLETELLSTVGIAFHSSRSQPSKPNRRQLNGESSSRPGRGNCLHVRADFGSAALLTQTLEWGETEPETEIRRDLQSFLQLTLNHISETLNSCLFIGNIISAIRA